VNPLYYVTFTTATLVASFILFGGFNTTDAVNTISLLCGFLIIFTGVYLLNLSREDPEGHQLLTQRNERRKSLGVYGDDEAIPTDTISAFNSRRSMQLRGSGEAARRSNGSISAGSGETGKLFHNYDVESAGQRRNSETYGLDDLASEDDDSEDGVLAGSATAKRKAGLSR
jgi:hypothetical protein